MTASVWTPGDVSDISQVNADNTYKSQQFTNTTQGQTLFILTNFAYAVGTTSLEVNINGVKQFPGIDFIETSGSSFTLLQGVDAGDIVAAFGLIGSPAAASAAVSAATSQAAAAAALISESNSKTSETNSKASETNAALSAINAANAANSATGAQLQSDWNQTNNSFKDYIKNKPSAFSTVLVSNTNESIIASGYAAAGVLNVNYRGATTPITQVKFFSGRSDNILAAVIGSNINGNGDVTGTATNLTGIAGIANGGTGATTAVNALNNLGGVPAAGGTMSGPLVLNNNTSLQFKRVDGTAATFSFIGTDNNLNFVLPTAASVARWFNFSSSVIWFIDNTGNTSQSGKLTSVGAQFTAPALFFDGSSTTPGITFTGDSAQDTGFFRYAEGAFAMTNNSTITQRYTPSMSSQLVQFNIDTSAGGANYTSLNVQNTNGLYMSLLGNGPNPGKTVRLLNGTLQIINNAYTTQIWGLADDGTMVISGSAYAVNFYASSDARLKQNWREVPNYVEKLAALNTFGVFDWIDGSGTGAGTSAQELEEFIPELVVEMDGVKKVDYNGISSYGVIALAKKVVDQEARIKSLEDKLSKLVEKLCL